MLFRVGLLGLLGLYTSGIIFCFWKAFWSLDPNDEWIMIGFLSPLVVLSFIDNKIKKAVGRFSNWRIKFIQRRLNQEKPIVQTPPSIVPERTVLFEHNSKIHVLTSCTSTLAEVEIKSSPNCSGVRMTSLDLRETGYGLIHVADKMDDPKGEPFR